MSHSLSTIFILMTIFNCIILNKQLVESQETAIIEALSAEKKESKRYKNVDLNSWEICLEDENFDQSKTDDQTEMLPSSLSTTNDFNPQSNFQRDYKSISSRTYQVDALNNLEIPGISLRKYDGVLYPYINSEMPSSFNPIPPVRYLPPVYLPLHDTFLTEKRESDQDVIENIRPPRVLRSENDFWDQLQHDTIMKNILPTMPTFLRNTEDTRAIRTSDPYYVSILFLYSPKIIYSRRVSDDEIELPIPYAYAFSFMGNRNFPEPDDSNRSVNNIKTLRRHMSSGGNHGHESTMHYATPHYRH
ncbi:uncharacterized protein LOC125064823 [Vanessa atalanta]|uniref:uncharacterized protein LOC125064823 n=1 Tax=Vanessa atalanta TaxID=42275 RepID=UPI001FCE1755|nr:uncharacterized protein LOC125064823 [Vanessa atalanta]